MVTSSKVLNRNAHACIQVFSWEGIKRKEREHYVWTGVIQVFQNTPSDSVVKINIVLGL